VAEELTEIVGTETVAPFRDAVCFVYCKKPDSTSNVLHLLHEAFVIQPFWSAIENLELSISKHLAGV
jgi:hypothetical protein